MRERKKRFKNMKVLLIFLTLMTILTGCNESTSVKTNANTNPNVGLPPVNQSLPSPFNILQHSFADSTALIKWSGSTHANYYEVRYRIGNFGNYATAITVGTSYMLTGLDNGHSYTVYIVARNEFGYSQTEPVVITPVSGVNSAPVAKNIALTLTEDSERVITLDYSDANGDPATTCAVSNLENLAITESCLCSDGVCKVKVKPFPDYYGSAAFKYTVANDLISNQAAASITVLSVDDAPIAYNINPTNFILGEPGDEDAGWITLPYSDAEGDLATQCYISSFVNGSVTSPCKCTSGICKVRVAIMEFSAGISTFDYEVRAGSSISNTGKVTLSLVPRPVLNYGSTLKNIKLGESFNVEPTILIGSGGPITGCSTTPVLPAWLSIDATTCKITGTPSNVMSAQSYTVEATGTMGTSIPVVISLSVSPAAPNLSYIGSTGTAGEVGSTMSVAPTTLNANGTPITGCTISPALPSWASINPGTCIISGKPTAPLFTTTYTITAHNGAGSSSPATVTLSVNAALPSLDYSESTGKTVLLGQSLTVIPSTLEENGSSITSCSSSPDLPVWATIDPVTCVITGTATTILPATTYTITATNDIGSTSTTVILTVNANIPTLSYEFSIGANGSFGVPMNVIPSLISGNGSPIHTCTASPALPSWATLNQTNCRITGTPDETIIPARVYIITATNSAGTSVPATLHLRVDPSLPVLSYSGAIGTNGSYGIPMSVAPTILQNKGGAIFQCEVTPVLPSWATIDPNTCVISGTPTSILSATSYSVRARNTAGYSTAATVVLRVNPAIPEISYTHSTGKNGLFNEPMSIAPSVFKNGGVTLTSCTSSPALPAWATLNTTTCVITGTPNQALSPSTFTITASNTTGSYSTTVEISVEPKVPTISYSGATGTNGYKDNLMLITPTTLAANGAMITGCNSSPALPAWLSLDPTTCVVSGTPSALMSATTYIITAQNSKGSSSGALLTIKVEDLSAPTVSYVGSTGTNGIFGTPMLVTPTILNPNGKPIIGCTITPALPAWASIHPTTCEITGTPTSVLDSTTYTVKAQNIMGFGSGTVTLSVAPAVPTLSYVGSIGKTGTFGSPMSITPTSRSTNGAPITNCFSEPALPAGLVIDPVTCIISGIPTVAIPATTYTIKAVNSAGTSIGSPIVLTINAIAPNLSYATSTGTTVNFGTAFNVIPSTLSPNGSPITTCTASPALPAGLTLDSSNCTISGIAAVAFAPTTFTITAGNAVGSKSADVTLTVNALPPALSYTGALGTNGAVNNFMSVSPTTFNTNGVPAQSCTISPALPAGLSINNSTCVISGIPTATLSATTYTITLSNGMNPDAIATVNLIVTNTAVPNVSFVGATGTSGTVGNLMTVAPTVLSANGDPINNCTISPALPTGLTLNTLTCVISGTPTSVLAATTFNVIASNGIGASTPAPVVLKVNAQAPSLAYNDSIGNQGTLLTITPTTLSPNGAVITDCSVTPTLPAGLSLNSTSCVISGTPSAVAPEASYSVTVTNSAGSTTVSFKITILPGLPVISYTGASGTTVSFGTAMNVVPTVLNANGGTISNCTISPALPAGLSIDPVTCAISGTSNIAFASTSYTVVAQNETGDSAGAIVLLRVNPAIPQLSYTGSSGTNGSIGSSMSVLPTTLNNNGAAITGCSSTPALPAWANLSPTTCTITGTPTEALPATTYSIIATNSAGSSTPASVTLTVDADAPTLSYIASVGKNGIYGNFMEVVPSLFNGNGYSVTQCEATPTLPAGLTVSPTTCTISGTPTEVIPATIFYIRATNTHGNFTDAPVTLTVSANIPIISYAFSNTHGETLGDPMVVTPSTLEERGASVTCSVSPALPSGFTLNASTCVISGTPLASLNSTHTVTVTNSAGSNNTSVTITAGPQAPALSYATSTGKTINYNATFNVQPSTLLKFGLSLTNCRFSGTPAQPAWMSIDPSTCTITGTPAGELPATTFNIIASNTLGDSLPAEVTLEVTPIPPVISYAGAAGNGDIGVPMTVNPIILKTNGGAITNCTISPALTNSLTINPLTCVISGTPTEAMAPTVFSVTAYNAGGASIPADVTLSVAQGVPVISYLGASGTTVNLYEPMLVEPTNLLGGPITGCTVNPALPAGLSIDPETCIISGTPTVAITSTYFVTATNAIGPSNGASLVLSILPIAPEISFAGATGTTGTFDSVMTVAPTILKSNGATVTCSISPSLPSGLAINSANCQITGTPTTTMAPTVFTVTATNAMGSNTANVTLSVGPATPILSYSSSTGKVGDIGSGMNVTPSTFNTRGAALSSCTISPTPPAWMSINPSTCVISGVPTTSLPTTVYTITATNSAGSTTATVNLSVNIAPPTISYGSPTITRDVGQALTLTTTTLEDYGSPIFECNIVPSLPSGLSISAPSCTISGTPTNPLALTVFNVTARNSAGSSVGASFSLEILAKPPTLSYAGATNTNGTVGYSMYVPPTTLNNNGSSIISCTISPTLPLGLGIHNTNCTISGAPIAEFPPTVFTITATNGRGSTTAEVTLSTGKTVPSLSYVGSSGTIGNLNTPMNITPATLSANGFPITSCVPTPALPTWLTINSSTCVITGTPTSILAPTNYTVIATNALGSSTPAPLTIEVKAGAPLLSFAGSTGTNGSTGLAMNVTPSTLSPNGSPITACTIAPALPTGLSINNTTCVISGTPAVNVSTTTFTVSATNAIGTTTATVEITVGQTVPEVSYVGSLGTGGVIGTPMNVTPTALKPNGSPIFECTISPTLPAGLTINNTTCVISGTPSVVSVATVYNVVAKNTSGSSVAAPVTISVAASAPTISYSGAVGTNGDIGSLMWVEPTSLNDHGAAIIDCTISPLLPSGLSIDPGTCIISGTPTANLSPTTYTVTAKNSIGNGTTTITLSVGVGVPDLSYDGATGTVIDLGQAMTVTPTTLELNGSAITQCTSSPTLPTGLSLNNSTCVISGTPTAQMAPTVFTITAKNASGFSSGAPVTLQVQAGRPTVSYVGSFGTDATFGVPTFITPVVNDNGSPIIGCTISPTLPSGLSINNLTCVISGTPTDVMPATIFNVTATNGTGSSNPAPVTISVAAGLPQLSYDGALGTNGEMNVPMSISPTVLSGGGSPITCMTVSAPGWLEVDPNTCVISGTPTANMPTTVVTIRVVTTEAEFVDANVSITVGKSVPELQYAIGDMYNYGDIVEITPTVLSNNGDPITDCEVVSETQLPEWATLDPTTCKITGTADSAFWGDLQIVAKNSVGSSPQAYLTLIVIAGKPELSYAGATGTVGNIGAPMTIEPTTLLENGSSIISCTVIPDLPEGLTIDQETCIISGTPKVAVDNEEFFITASHVEQSSDPASVLITVNPGKPTLSYVGSKGFPAYVDSYMDGSPSEFSANGAATTCSITSGVKPSWVTLNTSNCKLTGTPEEEMAEIILEISATNSVGTTKAEVKLEVKLCPDGFVNVPAFDDGTVDHGRFCVMKYEAQNVGGVAKSQPGGVPWTDASILDAQAACTDLGNEGRFDLISNAEWMSIARQAEANPKNWSGDMMYKGHGNEEERENLDEIPELLLNAPANEGNHYIGTGNSAAQAMGSGKEQRRTLYIGEDTEEVVIWDMAGNAWEWVDWDGTTPGIDMPNNCFSETVELNEVVCPGWLAKDYKPADPDLESSNGIGIFIAEEEFNLEPRPIIRGGDLEGGTEDTGTSGIFTLAIDNENFDLNNKDPIVGFRCVFRP